MWDSYVLGCAGFFLSFGVLAAGCWGLGFCVREFWILQFTVCFRFKVPEL